MNLACFNAVSFIFEETLTLQPVLISGAGPKAADKNKVRILAYKRTKSGSWAYVKSFKANYLYFSKNKTRYQAAVKLTAAGTWRLVAFHAQDAGNWETYGPADEVVVR